MKLKAKRFLIINPFGIGDVVFSTPVIASLKENFPEAELFYLCNKKAASIVQSHPDIKKVFIYERDDFVAQKRKSLLQGIAMYLKFIHGIMKERIDCAIDLSLNTPFGFFAFAAGIKQRYGLDYKNRGRFLNGKVRIDGFTDKHVADYYLDVLSLLGIRVKKSSLKVYPDCESRAWVKEFLEKNGIFKDDLVIGIAPCGGDAFGKDNHLKRWPAQNYTSLINRLRNELKAKIFIFAGPKEKEDVNGIIGSLKESDGVFNFSDTSVAITMALVERCDLFISNDTGILRFADALGKKIIAIYGPISEKVYGPYRADNSKAVVVTKDLPCRPCYRNFRLMECKRDRECLKGIGVEEVYKAAERLLNENTSA